MKEGAEPRSPETEREPLILHEGAGVCAIAKPAGLATQAPPGLPSVEAWLRRRLPAGAYLGVPHRLDRAVSGVLLLATTPRAARTLSRQFERREIGKTYVAILTGPTADEVAAEGAAEWRDFIVKVPDEPRARIAAATEPGAREAVTRVRIHGRPAAGTLLVAFEPLTGRMHQLRVQAAARGVPIVGDTLYGSAASFASAPAPHDPAVDPRRRPIALHAWAITYVDPGSGTAVRVEAPPSADWPDALRDAIGS